jgi:hypothetical protein
MLCVHPIPMLPLHSTPPPPPFPISRLAPTATPPPNPLPAVLRALFTHAQAAHGDPRVKAIVVTGAGSNFSAGFDINQVGTRSPPTPQTNTRLHSCS